MGVLSAAVLLLLVSVCVFADHSDDLQERYDFELNLEFQQPGAAPFKFFYTYDSENQLLKIAVEVLNLGWVGIGFSTSQFMPDIVTLLLHGWTSQEQVSFSKLIINLCYI